MIPHDFALPGATRESAVAPSAHAFVAQEVDAARFAPALALLRAVAEAAANYSAGAASRSFDLAGLDIAQIELIDQILGEGEVSAFVAAPQPARVQESVAPGIWRVRWCTPDGTLTGESVEVGVVPEAVCAAAEAGTPMPDIGMPPSGTMNVMPVLAEIRHQLAIWRPDQPNHVVNFTLLPMTPDDMTFLEAMLGSGPLTLASRGYGACRVQATAVRGVWSVRFFNSMGTIILDTLEVGGIPIAAAAQEEDVCDGAARLRDLLAIYG
jgi:hydrogenase-1 operon protein HyaF